MKLHAHYEDGRLIIQEKKYMDEGWVIRYDELKTEKKWEVVEVPLCSEERLYKCFDTLSEAFKATEELT